MQLASTISLLTSPSPMRNRFLQELLYVLNSLNVFPILVQWYLNTIGRMFANLSCIRFESSAASMTTRCAYLLSAFFGVRLICPN